MDGHKATTVFLPLRTNLVNLPSRISNLLANANIKVQDVIIEIVHKSGKNYIGWSGWNSSKINSLEIDPVLSQSFNLVDGEAVTLNLKVNNFETRQVNLEPLTSSDWELVELHAQTLEDKLLSQTRCVSLNQTLIVYPSATTSAKLLVTDIGTTDHAFAKLSPECEVAIAPKPKITNSSGSVKSAKSSKSNKSLGDYTNLPSVLKRSIPLPHDLYTSLPDHADSESYEVYIDFNEIANVFKRPEFVAVSVIAGPNAKINALKPDPHDINNTDKTKAKESLVLTESKRIVARLVNFPGTSINIGLSRKLAVALSIEDQIGTIVELKPAIKANSKIPSTFTIYPFIIQTKKTPTVNINSAEKKEKHTKLSQSLETLFYDQNSPLYKGPITNYTKIPIVPNILSYGGLLKFKRNDEINAWLKPFQTIDKKPPKIEIGEELLRPSSFIEQPLSAKVVPKAIGCHQILEDVIDSVVIEKNCGVLVHGNTGSGKTLILDSLGSQLRKTYGFNVKYISCETIMNENFNLLITNHFQKWLQECSWYKPSVLILDNLDKIIPAEAEHGDSSQSRNLTEYLIAQVQKIHNQLNSNFSIIGSASSKESLNGFLFSSHLFEHTHHLQPPDKSARLELLNSYFTHNLGCKIDFDIMDMVAETEGYLPNDLKTLSDRVYHECLFNSTNTITNNEVRSTKQDFEKALEGYTPSNLRGVKLQKSSINWSDVGGLKEPKNILLETLEWPTKYAPIFAKCPLRLRSGILLYGYPGCGKTLLASALAGQCGLNFISIKGPEILNKYIGASEQSVRELFERAQAAKPCILFFDEFDSIAPKRGHDSTGVTDRVVNQMLTQMDGAEGLDGVYILAATSRPDLIDSALLRPGRLDKSVICKMPDFDDRLDILTSITSKMELADDVDLSEIASQTEGFSGADMQGLGYNAYLKAVHVKLAQQQKLREMSSLSDDKVDIDFFKLQSQLESQAKSFQTNPSDRVKVVQQLEKLFTKEKQASSVNQTANSLNGVIISHTEFLESLKETKPSISVKEKHKLQAIYNKFVSGRDGNMPDGSASEEVGGRTTLM